MDRTRLARFAGSWLTTAMLCAVLVLSIVQTTSVSRMHDEVNSLLETDDMKIWLEWKSGGVTIRVPVRQNTGESDDDFRTRVAAIKAAWVADFPPD